MSSIPPSSAQASEPPDAQGVAAVRFAVGGMHCDSCKALIEESLGEHPAVTSATVDLDAGEVTVGYDPAGVAVEELAGIITEAGYSASPVG